MLRSQSSVPSFPVPTPLAPFDWVLEKYLGSLCTWKIPDTVWTHPHDCRWGVSGRGAGRGAETQLLVSLQSVPNSGHSRSHTLSPSLSEKLGSFICKGEGKRTGISSGNVRGRKRAGQSGMVSTPWDPSCGLRALAVLPACSQPARTGFQPRTL